MRHWLVLPALLLLATLALAQSRNQGYTVVYRRSPPPTSTSPVNPPSSSLPSSLPSPDGNSTSNLAPSPGGGLFSQFGPEITEGDSSSKAEEPPKLPAGLFFQAELVSGLLAPIGISTPILARAPKGWCGETCEEIYLLGTASLLPTGRALVNFQTAIEGRGEKARVWQADAVAFDARDLMYGLKGDVVDVAPALAADLVRAGIGGLADWADALLKSSTVVTTPSGQTSVTTTPPPLWATALGRVGQVVAPPTDTTALVRAVVLGAGSPIRVLTGSSLTTPASPLRGRP